MNSFLKILTLLVVAVMTTFAVGGAFIYEEPRYDIIHKADDYEVRQYYDRVAAQVSKAGSTNKAFRTLFEYISGENKTSEEVSMTTPVTQSDKVAITDISNQWDSGYMRFFLPASYTLDTAPNPTNPDVEVVVVKGGYYAVYSYSGRANDRNFDDAQKQLIEQLSLDGIVTKSEVIRATYNGPFTLPFNRRNEALVRIEWP